MLLKWTSPQGHPCVGIAGQGQPRGTGGFLSFTVVSHAQLSHLAQHRRFGQGCVGRHVMGWEGCWVTWGSLHHHSVPGDLGPSRTLQWCRLPRMSLGSQQGGANPTAKHYLGGKRAFLSLLSPCTTINSSSSTHPTLPQPSGAMPGPKQRPHRHHLLPAATSHSGESPVSLPWPGSAAFPGSWYSICRPPPCSSGFVKAHFPIRG